MPRWRLVSGPLATPLAAGVCTLELVVGAGVVVLAQAESSAITAAERKAEGHKLMVGALINIS